MGNSDAPKVVAQLERRLDAAQLAAAKERIAASAISNPVPIHTVEPPYPELARVARRDGFVVLQAVIRTDGSVVGIEVLRSDTPNLGFEDAAVRAVSQWRYEPARRQDTGEPLAV